MHKQQEYRHELKFLLPEQQLYLLEHRIAQICQKDRYTSPDGTYHIRSIYFDTFDDQYLQENLAGVDHRKKFRMRIYNHADSMIKLECKQTRYGLKKKEVCSLTKEQCGQLMTGNFMIPVLPDQEVLQQMQCEYMTKILQPKVIVEYVRTPFIYEIGNVRITFDRQIASSDQIGKFFDQAMPKRMVLPSDRAILEVKYDEVLPNAILEVLQTGTNLQRTSFSKYAMCRMNGLGR